MTKENYRNPPATAKDWERFWAKVDKRGPDECWTWKAGKFTTGYAQFWARPKHVPAHRWIWEQLNGPCGPNACHTCDNRTCVNPAHIYSGTVKQNADDCTVRGRRSPIRPFGEQHGMSKLTKDAVIEMRNLRSQGWRTSVLAERYRVCNATILKICGGGAWKHVSRGDAVVREK